MNERDLVSDVLGVLKMHVDDPFLQGQLAGAEDDIDLTPWAEAGRAHAARVLGPLPWELLPAVGTGESQGLTSPPEEFTGVAFDRCPDAGAQGRRDRCGQFSVPRRCTDRTCWQAPPYLGVQIPSGAHALDKPDVTDTELVDTITYRSTGRGAYDVVQTRAEGPDVVLAMVQFSEGVRGRVHALERFAASLRQTSQDVTP